MRSVVVVVLIFWLVAACAEDSDRSVATTPISGTPVTTSVTGQPIVGLTSTTTTPTATSPAASPEAGPGESISITETITITVRDADQP